MTQLRKLVLGGLAALAIGGAASSALAEEPGSFYNRLNGATIGLPLGALPPPGLYTGLETAYLGWPGKGNGNQGMLGTSPLYFAGIANAVPLLYVPGWNFLGASYAMSVVAAFYEVNVLTSSQFGSVADPAPFGQVYAIANPTWNPITLSWNLGSGWFVSAGFNFMAPIGTHSSTGTTNPDYWTLEPTFAVAWLSPSWVLAANFFYDINTASAGNSCCGAGLQAPGYTSGNILDIDLTAAWKIGKWQIGPVAYFEIQTTNDSLSTSSGSVKIGGAAVPGITNCATLATVSAGGYTCANAFNAAVGGLVGYNFGPVDLQVWVTDSVEHRNQIDGLNIWTRLGFRLWGPEAPKPLVAKN